MHSRGQSLVEASRRSSIVIVDNQKAAAPVAIVGDKPGHLHQEFIVNEEGKEIQAVDYSGAHAKTDPAEIKLVKKLDLWIMVSVYRSKLHVTSLIPSSRCSGLCTGSII